MPKLIKKYQLGSPFTPPEISNPYSTTKKPYTGNALGIDWQSLSGKDLERFKNAIAGPTTGPDPVYKSLYGNMGNQVQSNYDNLSTDSFNIDDGGGGSTGEVPGGAGLWNGIAKGAGMLSSLIPTTKSDEVKAADAVFDSVAQGVMMVNPMVGGIMMAGGLLSDGLNAMGLGTDQVTTVDKILGSKFLSLTPTGLINNSFSTRLHKLRNDQGVQDVIAGMGGGYGGFMKNWEEAQKYSGKKVGLLNNSNSLNRKVDLAGGQLATLEGIFNQQDQNSKIIANQLDRQNEQTMIGMNGGPKNLVMGRNGVKFNYSKLQKVHELLNQPKVYSLKPLEEEIQEFKDGGKMNVIPEGSLHARLHHMENAEGLTKKGIPVVTIAEGGQMEQQAEIELNEIIFNLDVTTELEKLMKDGSDNAAIEAGKLLVKEIFENTDDRTGLIKQLKPEKKEPTNDDIVKNHQVFKDGGVIEKINSLSPEQLEKLTKFLNEV